MKNSHIRFAVRASASMALAVLMNLANPARAQISVGGSGTGVLTFDALPVVTEWSTLSVAGGGADIHTVDQVDADVQTRTAASINTVLGSSATVDPSANAVARWNSALHLLQSRPTGNRYTILMATLRNDLGSDASSFTINYDFNMFTPNALEIPGFRVFYSFTGAANSWTLIPQLSDQNTPTTYSVTVTPPSNWPAGSLMYLLWADDNADTATDESYTIDNFSVTATSAITTCVAITNETSSISVPERGAATFSIMATGSPQFIQWYRSDNGGATFTEIPGANTPTYRIPSVVYPTDNGAQFKATVTNTICSANSTVKTLTVVPDTTAPTVISVVGDIDREFVHITFSEPMDVATISDGNFVIYLAGTVPPSVSGFQDYFTYEATLAPDGTNVTIKTDPRTAGENYMLEILDARDASSGNNVIDPNPLEVPIRPTIELIGFDTNNDWKYFVGSDIFGSGWEQPGYDDSAWGSGPAGLGLDSSANGVPIRTTIPYTGASEPTWYRKHFTFPGTVAGAVLTLRDVVEDGAVYYLNGQEVLRHNVGAGTLTYATRSAATQTDPTPIQGPFNIPTTSLVAGDNVLAVVVVQAGGASTDVELAVQLTATIASFAGGPPHITVPPQNETVSEGGNVTLSVSAEGALPLSYQWRHGGSDIPGATASSYTILGASPSDGGSYTVFISNSEGSTNSLPVTLTVVPDTTAPTIVSVAGDTNLSVVTVTLHDDGTGVDLAKAQNPANYQIALTAGGGTLTVVSAVATNIGTNTVVTLTTSAPRLAGQNYKVTITGVTDASVAANPVTPNTTGITATVVLSAFTSVWRYDQSGNDLGTAWKDVGYNDSAWPSGPGVLGFETSANTLTFLQSIAAPNGTNTVLSLTNSTGAGLGGTNVTFYFRTTVDVPFNPAGATFTIRAYVDDGAILYINGTEAWRYDMTNAAGYTVFADRALTEPNPNPVNTYVVTNITGLAQGNNVIAVEVHQDALASTDIDWGMQLEANVSDFNATGGGTGPALHISRNGDQVTVTWAGGGKLQEATDLLNGGATAWTDVAGNPAGTYTTTTSGPRKFYRVLVP